MTKAETWTVLFPEAWPCWRDRPLDTAQYGRNLGRLTDAELGLVVMLWQINESINALNDRLGRLVELDERITLLARHLGANIEAPAGQTNSTEGKRDARANR